MCKFNHGKFFVDECGVMISFHDFDPADSIHREWSNYKEGKSVGAGRVLSFI